MTTRPTVDDALQSVRDHDVPSIMSAAEIQDILDAAPPATPSAPPTPSPVASWVVTAAITVAAAGAVYLASSYKAHDPEERINMATTADHQQTVATQTDTALPTASRQNDDQPLKPVIIATSMIDATSGELTALGITCDGRTLRYRDESATITITTSGISVITERDAPSADVKPPRMVTLYRKGTHFAAWWDQEDSTAALTLRKHNVAPNELVPLRVTLRDPSSPLFREATVVLWYTAFRSGLEQFTERHVSDGVITASAVYPNPLHDGDPTLSITSTDDRTASIDIYDVQGNTVAHIADEVALRTGAQTIPLVLRSALPTGMYVVVVRTDHREQIMQRLMIER